MVSEIMIREVAAITNNVLLGMFYIRAEFGRQNSNRTEKRKNKCLPNWQYSYQAQPEPKQ